MIVREGAGRRSGVDLTRTDEAFLNEQIKQGMGVIRREGAAPARSTRRSDIAGPLDGGGSGKRRFEFV